MIDGTVTFTNAIAHADVLKVVAALGTNGVLTIDGGTLSADTERKLYASGSNGAINFTSNVSLSSNSSVIIAGSAVTINNGVVVTITGDDGARASVFANASNYTGSGGNGSTTRTFAGNGATTAPLDQAPPFDNFAAPVTRSADDATRLAPVPPINSRLLGDGGGSATVLPHRQGQPGLSRVADSNKLLNLAEWAKSPTMEIAHQPSNAPIAIDPNSSGPASLPAERPAPSAPKSHGAR